MYLNNDSSNYRYFIKCSDDGTGLAHAQAISFIIMGNLKILTMGKMQLHQKQQQAHLILLEQVLKRSPTLMFRKVKLCFSI